MAESVWVIERKGRKGKTYSVRWIDPPTGKQRCQSHGTNKRAAYAAAATKRQDLTAGLDTDLIRVPWEKFKAAIIEAKRATVKASTVADIEQTLNAFTASASPRSADRVRHEDVLAFFAARKTAGDSEATRDKHRRNLRLVFNVGIRLRYLKQNPVNGVGTFKAARKDWHLYEAQEVDRLLEHADTAFWWPTIYLAYTTALRKCELLYLTWADVDFKGGVLKVSPKSGKGLIPWTTKSHERRVVPLTAEASAMLQRRKLASDPENPYVLLPTDRYRHLIRVEYAGRKPVNNFTRDWRKLCEVAGVPVGEFHSLRKSRTTLWLEAGVPPHTVQGLCGHSSLETTIRYYGKVRSQGVDAARKASEQYEPGKIVDKSLARGA